MDISVNVKRDTNDNLCQHLVKIENSVSSTWASTTSILHIKESSQGKGNLGKENQWFLQGERDAESSIQEWGTIPL